MYKEERPERPLGNQLYGLPVLSPLETSWDIDCCKYQALLLFCHFPFEFVDHHESNMSPSGNPC